MTGSGANPLGLLRYAIEFFVASQIVDNHLGMEEAVRAARQQPFTI